MTQLFFTLIFNFPSVSHTKLLYDMEYITHKKVELFYKTFLCCFWALLKFESFSRRKKVKQVWSDTKVSK